MSLLNNSNHQIITVWINCSSDLKKFANSRPSASNFKIFSWSLEQFFLTVGQNNFGNKIPFLSFWGNVRRKKNKYFAPLSRVIWPFTFWTFCLSRMSVAPCSANCLTARDADSPNRNKWYSGRWEKPGKWI